MIASWACQIYSSFSCEFGSCKCRRRKSKLVTIYDLKLKFGYTQKEVSEGQEPITGTLTALEVGHDMDEDEYQFEAQTDSSGDLAMQLREEARQKLAVHLRSIFQELPKVRPASMLLHPDSFDSREPGYDS